MTNITKHSQATAVTINLESTERQISLSIEDNGIGFDPSHNTTGFGLQSMAERTSALQGELAIRSHSNLGTQIKVQIPLSFSNY